MAQKNPGLKASPADLIHKLCTRITGLSGDAVTPYYQHALRVLGSNLSSRIESDEFEVAEKIKRRLVRQKREKDAAIFSELNQRLQSSGILKNSWAILYLLLNLSEDPGKQINVINHGVKVFGRGLPTGATSTPYGRSVPHTPAVGLSTLSAGTSGLSAGSSGISSIHGSVKSGDPSPVPHSYAPSALTTPAATPFNQDGGMVTRTNALGPRLAKSLASRHQDTVDDTVIRNQPDQRVLSNRGTGDNTQFEIPESLLVKDIVYIFQGIEGKHVKFQITGDGYKVDSKAGVPKAMRSAVQKLAECGWLFSKVRKYVDARSADKAFGLVGQSFCAALHQELAEYYRLMAVLEAQLQQEQDQGVIMGSAGLTLRRLAVWTNDPLVRLKALAALVDICKGKKGGALASVIHSYIQHGDPSIRALIKHTLTLVAQPIYNTITRWIYDGELEDIFHEFFVASDPTVKDERLWHDKYSLRKSMVPSFLTIDQARKILLIGKSINFLRQVCQDRTTIRGRDVVKAAEIKKVESIFSQDLEGVFQKMIDTIYKETSQHLLDVLNDKYKFMDHLKANRRYLLLGQGDFIRHLMDLLEEDLAKPAGALYLHNLTGILETAVRATNAQFEDNDILKRLDVRMLEVSPGDTGWDVFSLDYHVDGPIRTVFTPECMIMYLRAFNFLWRAKRMEYILAGIWKGQVFNTRLLRSMPELSAVLHQCHIICSEMVHFIQQVQYYINFEVLECSWDELLQKVSRGGDLDHIIAAHQEFLDSIVTRCLLDDQSRGILTQLRAIFDLVIQFQTIQDNMYQGATEELYNRHLFADKKKYNTEQGDWGLSEADEQTENERVVRFQQRFIPQVRAQLQVLSQSYEDMVKQFLVMLAGHSDASLRFLSFRLDFNEHYRAKEPKLRSPLAFHKAKRKT